MQSLPDSVKQLIDSRGFANVATLLPDGSPHVVMTWVDRDGDTILINTIVGSRKYRNAKKDPRIALTLIDLKNEYNVAVVRGRVKEVTTDGAEEHIDRMAKKYLGQDRYPMHDPKMKRILIKIEPLRVTAPFTDTRPKK